jgi:uncharacterized SAM-binding protein YcdF (DUF218 family)
MRNIFARTGVHTGGQRGFLRSLSRLIVFGVLGFSAVIALLSLPATTQLLMDRLEVFPPITVSSLTAAMRDPPGAIVILSAGRRVYAPEFGTETLDELSLERVRYGALLARATRLPVLVSGGLGGEGRPSLAQLMADALRSDYGIAAQWLESRSANTAENAILSAEILRSAGIKRVILVTHAWHMKRARAAFLANGISVLPGPTAFYGPAGNQDSLLRFFNPDVKSLRMSAFALHEIVGFQWYRLRYGF